MRFLACMVLVATLVREVPSAQALSPDDKAVAATQVPGGSPAHLSEPLAADPVQTLVPGQGQVTKADERILMMIHDELAKVISRNEVKAIGPHLADDWTFISSKGNSLDKSEFLKLIKSGDLRFESLILADRNVRFYGTTAVVAARSTVKAIFKGMEVDELQQSSDVFIRNNRGEWICVLTHTTQLAKKRAGAQR